MGEPMCIDGCPSLGRRRPGKVDGDTAIQMPAATSTTATTRANHSPAGSTFSAKISGADDHHPGHAHDTECEQRQHQSPAAADAEETVFDAHADGARGAGSPCAEDEVQGAAAVPKTDALERGQLVDPGGREGRACDIRTASVPVQEAQVDVVERPVHTVGSERRRRSTSRDSRRGTARSARPRAASGALAADPGEESTIGATDGSIIAAIIVTQIPTYQPNAPRSVPGPGVHTTHALEDDDPRDQRGGEQGADDVERTDPRQT